MVCLTAKFSVYKGYELNPDSAVWLIYFIEHLLCSCVDKHLAYAALKFLTQFCTLS